MDKRDVEVRIEKVNEAVAAVKRLDPSRKASLAITSLEVAELWLTSLMNDIEDL